MDTVNDTNHEDPLQWKFPPVFSIEKILTVHSF